MRGTKEKARAPRVQDWTLSAGSLIPSIIGNQLQQEMTQSPLVNAPMIHEKKEESSELLQFHT